MTDPDLPQLVEQCLGGDESAWRRFVDLHSRLVYSIPSRNGFDDAACDDIFQNVFLAAYRHLDSLRDAQSIPKWLITTTTRACAQYARKNRTRLPETPPETVPEPELERQERLHALHRGLDELGGRCRDLLLALYCRKTPPSYDLLSEELDVPRGSIGPTRQRCLEKLTRIIASQTDLGPLADRAKK